MTLAQSDYPEAPERNPEEPSSQVQMVTTASTEAVTTGQEAEATTLIHLSEPNKKSSIPRTRKGRRTRSDIEIIGAILRAASLNGGMSMTKLRQKAGFSQATTVKYVKSLLECNLLSVELSYERNPPTRIFRPTELGYDFLLEQREIIDLLGFGVQDRSDFWD